MKAIEAHAQSHRDAQTPQPTRGRALTRGHELQRSGRIRYDLADSARVCVCADANRTLGRNTDIGLCRATHGKP